MHAPAGHRVIGRTRIGDDPAPRPLATGPLSALLPDPGSVLPGRSPLVREAGEVNRLPPAGLVHDVVVVGPPQHVDRVRRGLEQLAVHRAVLLAERRVHVHRHRVGGRAVRRGVTGRRAQRQPRETPPERGHGGRPARRVQETPPGQPGPAGPAGRRRPAAGGVVVAHRLHPRPHAVVSPAGRRPAKGNDTAARAPVNDTAAAGPAKRHRGAGPGETTPPRGPCSRISS